MDSRQVFLVVFVISSVVPYTKANGNITALNYNFTNSDCGATKSCVQKPNPCDPSGTSECFYASMRFNLINSYLGIELSGSSSGYIVLAAGARSDLSQGDNAVFACVNNNGSLLFRAGTYINNNLVIHSFGESNIQYRLKQPSIIQCAFTIPLKLMSNNTIKILGIDFNITNIPVFLEVYKGSYNGTDFGAPMSAFGSSVSVNLADVKSSGIPTAAPTTKPSTNDSTSLFSHAALGLLAAVALRFL